ncbi:hypothetical protein GLOTRDRAFT_134188 [Gloeophyllum trabeum ATCC 11539]|uniref:Uncharacterized protein n=1 Tax=Gloeophyllum trabeum (strain ATCC 11539 / FP-39264 / Madison 617) TaxID=670483 RepID=S7R712_GLOTA|nr:uncharacterized protein GLOTRDRAFT_134188 [Gloeophyllum trabeum ATCC 11539]EPQ50175.1 hypothetical protein GLOTRDRAFT_134188 [Gloeophyllum trabeum ATCC 11539]
MSSSSSRSESDAERSSDSEGSCAPQHFTSSTPRDVLLKVLKTREVDLANAQESLKACQLENGALRDRIHTLEAENARMSSMAMPAGGSNKDVSLAVEKFGDDVKAWSRKYFWLKEPFMASALFSHPLPDGNTVDYRDDARFSNDAALLNCLVAEVADFLPDHLQEPLREDQKLAALFRSHHAQTRATAISNLRTHGMRIFDFSPQDNVHSGAFYLGFDRAKLQIFQSFLKWQGRTSYRAMAPILYPNKIKDDAQIFRNPILYRAGKVLLLGPTSLDETSRAGKKSKVKTLGINSVEEGTIAMIATLVIFVLSPDRTFPTEGKGAVSGIDYQVFFNNYKRILLSTRESQSTKETMALYNLNIFGSARGASGLSGDPLSGNESDVEEIEQLLERARLQGSLEDEGAAGRSKSLSAAAPEANDCPISATASVQQDSGRSDDNHAAPVSIAQARTVSYAVSSDTARSSSKKVRAPRKGKDKVAVVETAARRSGRKK